MKKNNLDTGLIGEECFHCFPFYFIATPVLDFMPVSEKLTFTAGQSKGDSVCAEIAIIQDVFVETQETFEVMLLPNPSDILGAIIQPSNSKAVVIISDDEMDRSM